MPADLSRLDKFIENLEDAAYLFGTGGTSQPLSTARAALLAAIAEIVEERDKFKSALEQFARIKLNE